MLNDPQAVDLIDKARKAREKAYAPYSGFAVGAALLTVSGRVYIGCNVENVTFGATICAERSAVCAAISGGERDFKAIAIATHDGGITPCGICRQFLAEFSKDGSLEILCADAEGFKKYLLKDLLPHGFKEFHSPDNEINLI